MIEFHTDLVRNFGMLNPSMNYTSRKLQHEGYKILDTKITPYEDGMLIVLYTIIKKTDNELDAEKDIPMSIKALEEQLIAEHMKYESANRKLFR